MSIDDERAVFFRAHLAWGENDLDTFMSCLAEDIVYVVNVEGVPYAASANGSTEVRARLQLLLDTFVVDAFVMESCVHEPEFSRSRVLGYYKHKKTGERLDTKLRFHGWVKNGLLVRIEECLDAPYVEAFERFVVLLQAEAEAQARALSKRGHTD